MNAEDIKNIRFKRGETIRQFADTVGVDKTTVVNWEQGHTNPKGLYLRVLEKLRKRTQKKC